MATIASEKENLRSTLEIAPTAMDSLHLGFDHSTGSQNSRVGIAGNIWTADGFICGMIQQAPGVPRALKDVACDLIAQLLSPIVDNLPPLPPGYEQYSPEAGGFNKNGVVNVPAGCRTWTTCRTTTRRSRDCSEVGHEPGTCAGCSRRPSEPRCSRGATSTAPTTFRCPVRRSTRTRPSR